MARESGLSPRLSADNGSAGSHRWRCSCLAKGVEEEAPDIVIMEDGFPAVAPRQDLMIGTGILDAKAARHARQWLR